MRTIVQALRSRDAAAEVKSASDALTAEIVAYERAAAKVPPYALSAFERGRATEVGMTVLSDLAPIHRRVVKAQERLRCARNLRDAHAQVRLVALDAYEHRADLRAEGYRFDPAGWWEDVVGMHTRAAWVRVIDLTSPAAVEAATEAIARARLRGCVEGESALNTISQEVRRA